MRIQTTINDEMGKKIVSMSDYLGISKNDFIRNALVQYMISVGQAQDALNAVAVKELEKMKGGKNI